MIPNFAIVDEAQNIYRGAQPVTLDDWTMLWDRGVRHVLKLNTEAEGSDFLASEITIEVKKCPITLTQQILTEPDLLNLRTAVSLIQPNTFIHCGSTARTQHAALIGESKGAGGEDRTGVAVGYWRVMAQGWPKAKAYEEMLDRGFHAILFGLAKAWADLPETV
jgi:hypothetical protein